MNADNYKLLYDFSNERFKSQIDRNNDLDGKVGRLLNFTTAFLGVTIILLGEGIFTKNIHLIYTNTVITFLVILMIIFLGLTLYQLIKGIQLRSFSSPKLTEKMLAEIDKDDLSKNYKDFSERLYECINDNYKLLEDKSDRLKNATMFVSMAISVFGLIAIAYTILFLGNNIISLWN